ncbi:class I SAM-dependent methyltransferase [Metabacillus halosaccharovorans]|uniref:class I SAM-dependent methyltransferase n=1 Tax=Metabacillus halosaccharovorans TaxID=930124 RepID=UPI0009955494|nr:class I SAM-dependent methyltransferase [Metabacillus halosaccharovorans]
MERRNHWDANLYDQHHSFVSEYGQGLVELLKPMQGERILDVGCGTGDLMNTFGRLGVSVLGVDQSEPMIVKAKEKYPQLNFEVRDVLELGFKEEFDAVFSNATLHWVKEPMAALEKMFESLKVGGRFVAEFGGVGNVELILNEFRNQCEKEGYPVTSESLPWYFPSIGEYTSLMEKVGFKVTYAVHFSRPTALDGEEGLRNWLRMFMPNFLASLPDDVETKVLENVENSLRSILYKNQQWEADYKRIRVMAIK